MRVAAISDLHGHLPNIPTDVEALLIAGDICCHGSALTQLGWLDKQFRDWLTSIKVPVFACAGNHDWPFYSQQFPRLRSLVNEMNLPFTYLEDSGIEFNGYKIWGTPWQLVFGNWAFNLDEYELSQKWSLIPNDTDILICHSPPYGFGDNTPNGEMVGSPSLYYRVQEIKPKLVVYGHIHNGRGNWRLDDTVLANVTILDESYEMVYEPFVIDC